MNRPRDPEPGSVEATPAYRRYLAAAAWAGGSARDWDRGVRSVLAELVELVVAERYPAGADPREAARALLGDELWALVDRDAPALARAPDRDALPRILDRLEGGPS